MEFVPLLISTSFHLVPPLLRPSQRLYLSSQSCFVLIRLSLVFFRTVFDSIMPSTSSVPKSYALVVLSADVRSGALAGDFAKISKEFMASGLQPTCLSSLDLKATMFRHRGPMLYGRDEMGQREEIFVLNEPPFYKLVQTDLKACVLRWVEDTVRVIKPDERMVMVICAHGGSGGAIFLDSSNGSEPLEVDEIYSALELLPNRVSILFINLACYAGSWGQLTRLGANRNIMAEAASSERRTSRNHISSSLKCRCSFFRSRSHTGAEEISGWADRRAHGKNKRRNETHTSKAAMPKGSFLLLFPLNTFKFNDRFPKLTKNCPASIECIVSKKKERRKANCPVEGQTRRTPHQILETSCWRPDRKCPGKGDFQNQAILKHW